MENTVDLFTRQVIDNSEFTDLDFNYLRNKILSLVGEENINLQERTSDMLKVRNDLVNTAIKNKKIDDLQSCKDILGAELMDLMTPIPSVLNEKFWSKYVQEPQEAIKYFYELSKKNDYIKVEDIKKNIHYTAQTNYGELEITINLSKPEKDPKDIAAEKNKSESQYPKCQLCFENEGYQGRLGYPARSNHRIIQTKLGDEKWGFQYSPYAYFNEHSIVLDSEHNPMVISQKTFEQLLEIVDIFPGYFAGSNADLPIVGGSILTHNHYQAGRHTFPMDRAKNKFSFYLPNFDDQEISILNWPMNVLRLKGSDKAKLVKVAEHVRLKWKEYSDEKLDIVAFSDGLSHHTVTPIARKKDSNYELDLVLRDNSVNEKHPGGIFHPHQDKHHIKKENIGLIEVMGLAILPPRLESELEEVRKYILNQENNIASYHLKWADEIKSKRLEIKNDTSEIIIRQELAQVFAGVLENAGVFKNDEQGQESLKRFLNSL